MITYVECITDRGIDRLYEPAELYRIIMLHVLFHQEGSADPKKQALVSGLSFSDAQLFHWLYPARL